MDFFIYNREEIKQIKEVLCGNILENQKVVGMLNGVIKEIEQYIQNAEQFMFGKKRMENFQKDMKSIILTLIKQMTELKIYNVFLATSIDYYTEKCEQTIKLLMEWNIDDAKNVDNIKRLMSFINEGMELIKDIVRIAQEQNLKSGERKIENIGMNTIDNAGKGKNNARFFYCAKASKKERNMGGIKNLHPTVKPLKLMEYLVKLTSMPNLNQIYLDRPLSWFRNNSSSL
jgi:hypothetical protein